MWQVDQALQPDFEAVRVRIPGLQLVDAHTHIGQNDPDGYRQRPEELLAQLEAADGARAAVFPMHEPDGYPPANDAVRAAAEASRGVLQWFCRVDPKANAVAEARRCLDAGARGIKLHPRAERFGMDEPGVRGLVELAHERRVPILIHAGRGIPALGISTIHYAAEFPEARFILAHGAISDLAWLRRELPSHPNVLIDTAWWNPADLIALFALVPPGQVVWASDSPYGPPASAAVIGLRCAIQAGLDVEQLRGVAGGQMDRLLAGDDLLDLGPAPGHPEAALHPVLDRIAANLVGTISQLFARADNDETLALARLACDPEGEDEVGPISRRVLELLDAFEAHRHEPPVPGRPYSETARLLIVALVLARTPAAG